MSDVLPRLYRASPVWLQHLEVSAFGFVWKRRRYGGRFRRAVAEFAAREASSPEAWRTYQTHALRQLLADAFGSVPHYRETLQRLGLGAADLETFRLDDLPQLPRLGKQTIREHPEAFISTTASAKRLHTYLTSGTTGTPLAVKFTDLMHQTWSAAYETRVRRWAGVHRDMSRAMIGGRVVVPSANAGPPFWRYNVSERQLYLSAFHIAPSTAPHYVAALNRFRPAYLAGYASSHFFLARMICEQQLRVHQPRAVLTSSETLTAEMRATIERAYGCRVFDSYSGVEACCLASECEHQRLHLSPDVGIVELLTADGRACAPGEAGEIVATGLLNFVQPLVRYRTGDWAIASETPCPCGRHMPVLRQLVGRLEDTVVGRDGREMVRFHGLFVGLGRVREGQVIQESPSRIRVRLVVDPGFGETERAIIRQRLEERLGPVEVYLEPVDRIERTERGKFRAVISHVPRNSAALHEPVPPS
jgi:phenylacetate-CoA ligase